MSVCCPLCGSKLPPHVVPRDKLLSYIKSTGYVPKVLEVMLRQTVAISAYDLANIVYADDPNGGPEKSNIAVTFIIRRLNAQLRPLGWEVSGKRPGSNGYLLVPYTKGKHK